MERNHEYQSKITWTGNRGSGTLDYRAYDRNYKISIEGKQEIEGSSDSAFSGDQSKHNPEDLLLSAVASCHMLWYLHLCSEQGIVVMEYTDNARGVMQEDKNGSGKFTEITLYPEVVITNESKTGLAQALHEEAGKMCFIANSLNFKVGYQPVVKVLV